MPYTIQYTDSVNKGSITVQDNDINNETTLSIPGKNTTGYGTAIGTNFLHLLENFASNTEPVRPVEGQLWYDSTIGSEVLKVYDGTRWVPAGGLKKANSEPNVAESQIGDLWADTDNQQLYLFTGSGWILVGPAFSDGLVTGATPVSIIGTDNLTYKAIQLEVDANIVAIIATQNFTPKTVIPGFTEIKPGFNLSIRNISGDGAGKFYGTAEKAENLIVNNVNVSASQFLRKDVASTSLFPISIQNNSGINYGVNAELNIGVEAQAGIIQHQIEGSNIDLRVKNAGSTKTVLRVDSNLRIGINNEAPDEALHVTGNIKTSGDINVTSLTQSDAFSTGSIKTLGGIGIAKNLNVGGATQLTGVLTTANILPDGNNTRNFGSSTAKFANAYATTFIGNLTGNVSGTVSGRAGSADKLTTATTFRISGDVSADRDIVFDGQYVDQANSETPLLKVFNVTLSNDVVAGKVNKTESQIDDEFLFNRVNVNDPGLFKISRSNLLKAVPINPPGIVLPFAGLVAPTNWLLCDGQLVSIANYSALFQTIGYNFAPQSSVASGFFRVPDLRGRLPMGMDNMGGTSADTVTASYADTIGGVGGSENKTILTNNLPEHKHNMRGDSLDQYYAIRDVTGTPADSEAIVYDAPTGTGNGQALPNSGGIISDSSVGQPLNAMNPTLSMNYIIYTGRA